MSDPAQLEILPDDTKELSVVVKEAGLAIESAQQLLQVFSPFAKEAHTIIAQSQGITDVKLAGAFRKRLKAIRVNIENTRKVTKDESMRTGKAIDGMANILKFLIAPNEDRLEAIEKAEQIKEEARKAKLATDRATALQPYGLDTSFMQLGEMPDETFAQLLENTRAGHEAKLAAERKANEDRIRLENERLKEEARIREENARLKREADEREAAAKAERERLEAIAAEERRKAAEAAELARKERERVEYENAKALAEQRKKADEAAAEQARKAAEDAKIAADKARKEREAIEAKAKAERDAIAAENARVLAEQKRHAEVVARAAKADNERLAAQIKAAREAAEAKERQEKADREEAEFVAATAKAAADKKAAAEAEAARLASLAPDKEKLMAFADKLRALPLPEVSSDEAKAVLTMLEAKIVSLVAWIKRESSVL